MPRPRCKRNIGFLSEVKYFKPVGVRIGDLKEIILGHDEVEAMRLKDLIGLPQEEAAREMNVSQSTFHRLILSAQLMKKSLKQFKEKNNDTRRCRKLCGKEARRKIK